MRIDDQIRVIKERLPDLFEISVNDFLTQGGWRVAETEMSVTDHHYIALLIHSSEEDK